MKNPKVYSLSSERTLEIFFVIGVLCLLAPNIFFQTLLWVAAFACFSAVAFISCVFLFMSTRGKLLSIEEDPVKTPLLYRIWTKVEIITMLLLIYQIFGPGFLFWYGVVVMTTLTILSTWFIKVLPAAISSLGEKKK